jgi:hypothetical protein
MKPDEAELIAELRALLLVERGVTPDRVYPVIPAVRLIGSEVDTERAARRILADFGIPTIPRSPGGKLRGVAGRDLIAHIERLRAEAA